MTTIDDQERDAHSLRLRRLQGLIKISSAPANSNRPSRVALGALSALDVQACAFHRLHAGGPPQTIAFHHWGDLEMAPLEQHAQTLVLAVTHAGGPHQIADLATVYPGGVSLDQRAASYLGVPVFDAVGRITGVASIFGARGREYGPDDEWWLQTAAQLVSCALTCETLEARIQQLESFTAGTSGEAAAAAAVAVESQESKPIKRQPAILLADDDRAVNSVIRRSLMKRGYTVDSAFDGLEAMRLFNPAEHDILISDIVMPHMDGWKLIATLRVHAPDVPVILITGFSSTSGGVWNQEFLRKHGVSAILHKPIDFDYLGDVLQDVLQEKDRRALFGGTSADLMMAR